MAAWLAALLPVGALCAPLVHAHLDDHHVPHHAGRTIHAHVHPHGAPPETARDADPHRPTVGSDEPGHTLALQHFLAVAASVSLPAIAAERYLPPALLRSAAPRPPAVTHGHDPPSAGRSAPRAPPA